MNRREKVLLIAIGSVMGLGIAYALVNGLLLVPKKELQQDIRDHTAELKDLEQRAGREVKYLQQQEAFLARTYLGDYDTDGKATQDLAARRLAALALAAGLADKTLDVLPQPIGTDGAKHGFLRVGLNATVNGGLQQVTDFLYLLRAEPVLHRIESLRLQPDPATGQVKLRIRYTTLAMVKTTGKPAAATTRPTTQPGPVPSLEVPARRAYDAIVSRDLFRPFIAKPAPPPPPPVATHHPPPPPRPRPSTDQYYRIVGLSTWSGDPADAVILVTDSRTRHTDEHLVGEKLGDGTIVCVDYRQLPTPDDPEVLSPSRAILKIKDRYYAVELGQTLAQKRVLKDDDLPEALKTPAGREDSSGTRPAEAG